MLGVKVEMETAAPAPDDRAGYPGSLRRDHAKARAIATIARRITCQRAMPGDCGMGAAEEIRQRRASGSVPSTIGQEGLPGEKASLEGNRLPFDRPFGQRRFQ